MGLGASRADHKKDDGYVPPSDRARARQAPAPSAVLTDPDVAAFDPTADKHDYLLVFATERSRSSETLKWNEVRETWFQAIPGDEEKKTAGVELLRRDWVQRFGEEEECPKGDVLGLCREHVVDLLARRSGLQLKLSLPSDGARRVYCQLRAPVSLLERKADALDYKFKFKDEIDPGPAFWRRSSGTDRVSGRPVYDEIVEDATILTEKRPKRRCSSCTPRGAVGGRRRGVRGRGAHAATLESARARARTNFRSCPLPQRLCGLRALRRGAAGTAPVRGVPVREGQDALPAQGPVVPHEAYRGRGLRLRGPEGKGPRGDVRRAPRREPRRDADDRLAPEAVGLLLAGRGDAGRRALLSQTYMLKGGAARATCGRGRSRSWR